MVKIGKSLVFIGIIIFLYANHIVIAEEPFKKRMFVSPQDIGIENAVDILKPIWFSVLLKTKSWLHYTRSIISLILSENHYEVSIERKRL